MQQTRPHRRRNHHGLGAAGGGAWSGARGTQLAHWATSAARHRRGRHEGFRPMRRGDVGPAAASRPATGAAASMPDGDGRAGMRHAAGGLAPPAHALGAGGGRARNSGATGFGTGAPTGGRLTGRRARTRATRFSGRSPPPGRHPRHARPRRSRKLQPGLTPLNDWACARRRLGRTFCRGRSAAERAGAAAGAGGLGRPAVERFGPPPALSAWLVLSARFGGGRTHLPSDLARVAAAWGRLTAAGLEADCRVERV